MTEPTPTVRIFYDTEFLERPCHPIELISIGMVAVDKDGNHHEYYAVREEMPLYLAYQHQWLRDNVVPHLPIVSPDSGSSVLDRSNPAVKPGWVITNEVTSFLFGVSPNTGTRAAIELWADYAAYDHVVFAQLFGRMIDLPSFVPMFTHDVQQFATSLGLKHCGLPDKPPNGPAHHALNDAHMTRERWEFLDGIRQMRQKQHDDYEDDSRQLTALVNAGVDNWQWYSEAMEAYRNPGEED